MNKVRIGIFGANRGMDYAQSMLLCNADIVAVCDKDTYWLDESRKRLGDGVTYYTDFDAFIEHENLQAVLLANYFNEHAPYAIRCLEKGIHVLSECTAAGTMAESVALVRAAEKSTAKYMLCENYPFMIFNREIKRICDGGTLGKILYAEGEYNHPTAEDDTRFLKKYFPYEQHWRNHNPRTYYITHSMAPLMNATGAEPIRVTALPVYAPLSRQAVTAAYDGDRAAIITTLNNDDSVFKVTGCAAFGAHGNSYRVCGTKGQIENLRGMNDQVMLQYNAWDKPEGVEQEHNLYMPQWNDKDEELILKAGHGGGDFLVVRTFLECILNDTHPVFDVYFATKMSSVAILAHRSLMENGVPYDVPDFRKEEDRVKWENDYLTPYYGPDGSEPTLPCCSHPDYAPTEEQKAAFRAAVAR